MQAFRRFLFHGHAKRLAFDVMSAQRAEKNNCSGCDSEDDKNRNRSSADQCFPSQGGKMGRELGLQSYIVTSAVSFVTFVTLLLLNESLCQSQLRKEKSASMGQLFDARGECDYS